MKSQSNKAQSACDVKIYSDKGSLALRFPLRHNAFWETMDGKSLKGKPKCLGIGKYGFSAGEPDDWKRATQIAISIEADLDHPEWDKLFDRTLAKYGLGGGKYAKLADIIQMPGTISSQPEITVGTMWENYLVWKKTVVEETTFVSIFEKTFSNAIAGKIWDKKTHKQIQASDNLAVLGLDDSASIRSVIALISISKKDYLVEELNQAFEFCKARDLLVGTGGTNPFLMNKFASPVMTTQDKYASKFVNGEELKWHEILDEKILEDDRRAFTKEERGVIIKAFYQATSKPVRFFAGLIEFYFLTGCRTSEALALNWRDVDFERNTIRFSKSLGQGIKKIKQTKTGETRLFYFGKDSRLRALLLEIQSEGRQNPLIFPSHKGTFCSIACLRYAWHGRTITKTLSDRTEVRYDYPGIVTQLALEGKIDCYLPQYHTRHTYITLTTHANAHNNNALLHIASACGNSVDVILRHYLGVDESVELIEV
jgi:integrase